MITISCIPANIDIKIQFGQPDRIQLDIEIRKQWLQSESTKKYTAGSYLVNVNRKNLRFKIGETSE